MVVQGVGPRVCLRVLSPRPAQTDCCPPTGILGSSPSTLPTTGSPATSLCLKNPPKPWQNPWGTCVYVLPNTQPCSQPRSQAPNTFLMLGSIPQASPALGMASLGHRGLERGLGGLEVRTSWLLGPFFS